MTMVVDVVYVVYLVIVTMVVDVVYVVSIGRFSLDDISYMELFPIANNEMKDI